MRRTTVLEMCVVALALVAWLPACGGDGFGSGGPAYPGEAPEDLGTAPSAVRAAACSDEAAPDATISVGASGSFLAQSPDESYDHADCRHRWIAEATNVANKAVVVDAGSMAIPYAGKEWCAGYWSENRALGCRASPCEWIDLGSWSERAIWRTGSSATSGECERVLTGAPPELASTHGFAKLRVVTQAGWVYWFRPASASFTVP